MAVSVSLLVENSVTAVIIIAYLFYEIRWGRIAGWGDRLDGVVDAIMALAREHDKIDEEIIAERINGESPEDFIRRYERSEYWSEDEE